MPDIRHPWAKNRNRRLQNLSHGAVINCLAGADNPLTPETIARRLELPLQSHALLMQILAELSSRSEIVRLPSGYRVFEPARVIRGTIKALRSGAGFILTPEGEPDGYLASTAMAGLFDGDRVEGYRLSDLGAGNRVDAMVLAVTSNPPPVIGILQLQGVRWIVDPLYATGSHPVEVPLGDPSQVGHLVIAQVSRRPRRPGGLARGAVAESFGPADSPGMASRVALFRYGLPSAFDESTLAEIKALPRHILARGRRDLTHLDFVTIDDDRAQSLDDALASVRHEDGGLSVYVAISDVAQLVLEGSLLDQAARQRGSTIYFPDGAVPMLPPALSDDRLSLLPGQPRAALVAQFKIDRAGQLAVVAFCEAMIQSRMRLNYEGVSRLLAGRTPPGLSPEILKSLSGIIDGAAALKVTSGEAYAGGDTELRIDPDSGEVTEVSVRRLTPAHQLVSQWMVATNRAVAQHLCQHGLPAIYRVQQCPEPRAWRELRNILQREGLHVQAEGDLAAVRRVHQLLESHPRGTELMREVATRLPAAQYALEARPHAGMGEGAYAHFTSPIRRYADLVNHRALKASLRDKTPVPIPPGLAEEINELARQAKLAERDVTRKLLCDFVEDKRYEVLTGTISRITDFGCFISLDGCPGLDALMHISRIGNESYQFDPVNRTLTGSVTQVCFSEGMRTRIRIGEINPWDGRVAVDGAHHEPAPELEKERSTLPVRGFDAPSP